MDEILFFQYPWDSQPGPMKSHQTNLITMAELFHTEDEPQYVCWDRNNHKTVEAQLEALKNTRTVYVGNLSFFSKESQIYETFSAIGPVKRVIMGLNQISKTPCGFCFVEYYEVIIAYFE